MMVGVQMFKFNGQK
jgi:hypothetical protein